MPRGTPLFVRVDANGSLAPYYEGHFHGQSGGSVSAVGIDARARVAGERTAPEYFPDYLTFSQPADPASGRGPVPVAGIWGEYPDPVTPLAGVTPSLWIQAFGASSRVTRKLLDSAGSSDFLQQADASRFNVVQVNNYGAPGGFPKGLLQVSVHNSAPGNSVITGIPAPSGWRAISGRATTRGYNTTGGYVGSCDFIVAGLYMIQGWNFTHSYANLHLETTFAFFVDTSVYHAAGSTYAQIVYQGSLVYDVNDLFSCELFWWG